MIDISQNKPFAKGAHRSCYRHPIDTSKCIKVLHEDWRQIGRRLNDPFRHFRRRHNFDENLYELRCLRKIERKHGERMRAHFPMTYGIVQTDLGDGLVCDMIQDANGQPSLSLKAYLWENGLTPECQQALDQFWEFLIANRIIVRDARPDNMAVATEADGALRIYLVDGFGRADFLPFVEWFQSLAEKKLAARRKRMEKGIAKHLAAIRNGETLSGRGVVRQEQQP